LKVAATNEFRAFYIRSHPLLFVICCVLRILSTNWPKKIGVNCSVDARSQFFLFLPTNGAVQLILQEELDQVFGTFNTAMAFNQWVAGSSPGGLTIKIDTSGSHFHVGTLPDYVSVYE
jgi:hypothetical protein